MFMFGNYTALKFISHTHLFTSIYAYPSQLNAIEFKRKRYGWMKEISNYISFFFNYCYLGVLSSVNLRAKRDIDHTFKTKTKTKRANSTKTKHSVSFIV